MGFGSDVNLIAVIVSGIAAMAIGALWYSPILFGKVWMKFSGLTEKDLKKAKEKGMAKSYVASFIAALVTAYVLAIFIDFAQVSSITDGIAIGALAWLGFVATIMLGIVLWENKPYQLYVLNAGHQLIALIVMSVILTIWV